MFQVNTALTLGYTQEWVVTYSETNTETFEEHTPPLTHTVLEERGDPHTATLLTPTLRK